MTNCNTVNRAKDHKVQNLDASTAVTVGLQTPMKTSIRRKFQSVNTPRTSQGACEH